MLYHIILKVYVTLWFVKSAERNYTMSEITPVDLVKTKETRRTTEDKVVIRVPLRTDSMYHGSKRKTKLGNDELGEDRIKRLNETRKGTRKTYSLEVSTRGQKKTENKNLDKGGVRVCREDGTPHKTLKGLRQIFY